MMLIFFALLSSAQVSDLLNDFERAMKNTRSLSADVVLKIGSQATGSGTFVMERPMRQAYKMKIGAADYSFIQTEKAMLEIEHTQKTYREYLPADGLYLPDSGITTIPRFGFPVAFMRGSLRSLIPSNARFEPAQTLENGQTALTSTFSTPRGTYVVNARLDKEGRLVYASTAPKGSEESEAVSMTFSNFKINDKPAAAAFSMALPVGYVPDVLPMLGESLNVGDAAPLTGFGPAKGGKGDLKAHVSGKPALLIIGPPDCEPTQKLIKSVAGYLPKITKAGGTAAVVWSSRGTWSGIPAGLREFVGSKESAADRFKAQASPFAVAIDKRGKITQVWVGFDPEKAAQYQEEILAALKGALPPPK